MVSVRLRPVSYTHLDVYKRQAYDEEGKPLNVDGGPSQYNPMLDVYQATNETRYYSVMFNLSLIHI